MFTQIFHLYEILSEYLSVSCVNDCFDLPVCLVENSSKRVNNLSGVHAGIKLGPKPPLSLYGISYAAYACRNNFGPWPVSQKFMITRRISLFVEYFQMKRTKLISR